MSIPFGVPGENRDSGAVNIINGSTNGLTAYGDECWAQHKRESGDRFGEWLLAGDFDGDGRDDLAVGMPGEDSFAPNAGAVNVIYGSSEGLTRKRDKMLRYDEFFRLLGAMP